MGKTKILHILTELINMTAISYSLLKIGQFTTKCKGDKVVVQKLQILLC